MSSCYRKEGMSPKPYHGKQGSKGTGNEDRTEETDGKGREKRRNGNKKRQKGTISRDEGKKDNHKKPGKKKMKQRKWGRNREMENG